VSEFSSADFEMMAHALRLARRGLYSAHPNPRVGCVLVQAGRIVGEGWHCRTGEPHAEINALAAAGAEAQGSTAYVTLEPCSHHGRTPPCADALIDAGVAMVIGAMQDPNPQVAGAGFDRLRQAGIDVHDGLMQEASQKLNEGFVSRVTQGRPFVRLKMATSLDGRTAMASGESQWITGEEARRDVQRLRASSGAILTGVSTVIDDDPSLTVREAFPETGGHQPLRAVVDSRLRLPPAAKMLGLPGRTVVFCTDDNKRQALETAGAEVIRLAAVNGRPDLQAVLLALGEFGVNDVLVESGPTLAGSLLSAGFVDELVIYQAPHIMGSETSGMCHTPEWLNLNQRLALNITDIRKVGDDLRITARPAS
jgi:diaminohydroxyphosphoribosylaminopyrimidine deaminase/5-amino-6-(5-phosphoribosylamino)uracil reductase